MYPPCINHDTFAVPWQRDAVPTRGELEAAVAGHTAVCECEAGKVEAQAPSDAQLSELENNPMRKERLVKLMINASYACLP
jgi:hypothetical protein